MRVNTTRIVEIPSGIGAISARRLQQIRQRGGDPPFVKIGHRVLCDLDDVRAWLERRKRSSTSDDGGCR